MTACGPAAAPRGAGPQPARYLRHPVAPQRAAGSRRRGFAVRRWQYRCCPAEGLPRAACPPRGPPLHHPARATTRRAPGQWTSHYAPAPVPARHCRRLPARAQRPRYEGERQAARHRAQRGPPKEARGASHSATQCPDEQSPCQSASSRSGSSRRPTHGRLAGTYHAGRSPARTTPLGRLAAANRTSQSPSRERRPRSRPGGLARAERAGEKAVEAHRLSLVVAGEGEFPG